MRGLIIAFVMTLVPSVASAKDIIECVKPGKEPIRIILDAKDFEGRKLSCLEGDFIVDMQPCAPNGGYGLSRPTGSASLYGVVDRWQDLDRHLGGTTLFFASDTKIRFDGFFRFDGENEDLWTFEVDRISGVGKLSLEGKPAGDYACHKATPKL